MLRGIDLRITFSFWKRKLFKSASRLKRVRVADRWNKNILRVQGVDNPRIYIILAAN